MSALNGKRVPDAVVLSVVVPTFNESGRLGASLAAIRAHLNGDAVNGRSWELIIVDDGSTDDTAAIAERAGATDPRVRLVRLPRNRGKGAAVRRGVLASRGRYVLISDADLSTPITDLELLLAALRPGMAAAIGSRALAMSHIQVRQHPVREMLGRLGNRFVRLVAVADIADTQCGFKLLDGPKARVLFPLTLVDGWGFDIEVLHLCQKFGWPVAEVPVRWAHVDGSRLRPLAYLQVLRDVVRTRLAHRGTQAPRVPAAKLQGVRSTSR